MEFIMSLHHLGWNSQLSEAYIPFENTGLIPARIKRVEREHFYAVTDEHEYEAVLSGSLRHSSVSEDDYAVIGDWVLLYPQSDGKSMIEYILPRKNFLSRKEPGETSRIQPIAANVDTLFILLPMAANFNPRRIERYILLALNSMITPVVLLTKSDTAINPQEYIEQAQTASSGYEVIGISSKTGSGVSSISHFLKEGSTIALLGPSGAGKSSLINALMGENVSPEGSVRQSDGRGRHMTTSREFFILPSGALVIDNPGIRELALAADDDVIAEGFDDIERLSANCRFKDCRHESEPGCAVLRAIESGILPPGRLSAFRKLLKEARYIASRTDARIRSEEKQKWKQIGKLAREIEKKNKY
jgi:ribosome biogenesis GTPase / thiamine phosphate phosphatase